MPKLGLGLGLDKRRGNLIAAPVAIAPYPFISGNLTEGSTLSITPGTWTGIPTPTLSYQWKRGATNIGGAIGTTYVSVLADSEEIITCVETATNEAGSASQASNALTMNNYKPVNTGAPVVSGNLTEGSTLTTTNGTWTGTGISYTYQWTRNGVDIGGATNNSYVSVLADSEKQILCVVKATNSAGNASANSNYLTMNNYKPVNTVAPAVTNAVTTGLFGIGEQLSCSEGTWTGTGISYSYTWYRGATVLATINTYTPVTADIGQSIKCVVRGTNAAGFTDADSNAETIVNVFVSTWDTTKAGSASNTIVLPYEAAGTYEGTIYWGDGTTSTNAYANRTKVYAASGIKTVKVVGVTTGFRFANADDKLKITNIARWGALRLGNSGEYFRGCKNLTLTTVADILDLTGTTDCSYIFADCTAFTTVNNMNSWNMGAVTKITGMFQLAVAFNQNIGSWNTGAVTAMNNMFFGAAAFNQNIGSWNTGAVKNMEQTFRGATAFNQNIGSWDTAKVTNMYAMFYNALAFNQNIGSWNVSLVTNFTDFMFGKTAATFSAANLDAIYNGWSSRSVQASITITFGSIKYTSAGVAGRAVLTDAPNNWSITDGGI